MPISRMGVPEGYTFKDYFDNHRPYMRCWDTGQECGLKERGKFEDAMMTDAGKDWAIMGAGREGENCAIGGSMGRIHIPNPSPITSWAELKIYEMRAIQKHIFCLPRNDKMFKDSGSEDFVLQATGAVVQTTFNDAEGVLDRFHSRSWPYPWRGYVADPSPAKRFPNFGSAGGAPMSQGLSNAKPGNIAVYDSDVVFSGAPRGEGEYGNNNVWRMPHVAFITGGDNALARQSQTVASGASENIRMTVHDYGKFPDACGNTNDLGMGQDVQVFKTKLEPDRETLSNASRCESLLW